MKKEVLNLGWGDSRRVQGFAALDTGGRPFLFRRWPRKEYLGLQLLIISVPTFILLNLLGIYKPDTTVLKMVNEIRVENGLSPVKYNRKLARSSMTKACDMNEKHYITHTSPDGKLWEFIKETGYHFVMAGENLGQGCTDEGCVQLWLRSPKHKAIILDPRYKEGAVSRCGDYVALHFGTRLTLKQKIQIMIFRLKAILKQEAVLKTTNT